MKHIVKLSEPQELVDWKNQENEDWKPSYNALAGEPKKAVLDSLLAEQGHICCYCQRELRDGDYHIEHFKPKDKEKFPALQLDYSNLHCSCQKNLKSGTPRHCGNSKENWFDEGIISPLESDCETKFSYTFDGHIEPRDKNDERAMTTIKKLQLDINKLINMRKKAIEAFINEELSDEEFNLFLASYLRDKAENGGKFNPFYTTIQFLFPFVDSRGK